MYSLIAKTPVRQLLTHQAPAIIGALLIAEMFYKWHSFLLETGGFLLTWFVLDAAGAALTRLIGRRSGTEPTVS
jgi:hypothetical protein